MEFDRLDIQLKNAIPGTAPGISFFMLVCGRSRSDRLRQPQSRREGFYLPRGIFTLPIFSRPRRASESLKRARSNFALNGLGQILLICAPSNFIERLGQIQGTYERLRQIQDRKAPSNSALVRFRQSLAVKICSDLVGRFCLVVGQNRLDFDGFFVCDPRCFHS